MVNYFACPHCEADVPVGASACPVCGSDEETGWSEAAEFQSLFEYYPDSVEDYEPEYSHSDWLAGWGRPLLAVVAALTLSAFVVVVIPWGIYLVPVIVLAVGAFYYLTIYRPGQQGRQPLAIEQRLYENLLYMARGDRDLVERLLDYERQRHPNYARRELLEAAIESWERDRR